MSKDPDNDHADAPVNAEQIGLTATEAEADSPGDEPARARRPVATLPSAGVMIRNYELIRSLGRGGMGAVFLARDLKLGRLVAIKFLSGAARVGGVEQVLAEARATARCQHENIVVIHDASEHHGLPYLVFEYLEGQTLHDWLASRTVDDHVAHGPASAYRPPAPAARVIELMLPIARALAAAHRSGIVHRDLKPANVMLTRTGVVKVLDFGIAQLGPEPVSGLAHTERTHAAHEPDQTPAGLRAADDPASAGDSANALAERTPAATGAIRGTLAYMAPEQLAGRTIDERADIWAFGIMLHELATGQHPLAPYTRADLLAVVEVYRPMPSARRRYPQLGALAALIDRCLVKDRARRLGSADELLSTLAALAAEPASVSADHERNPFKGLSAFKESDSQRFFGRQRDIPAVLSAIDEKPLVALVGPSGVGKSSFVRAGVVPALARTGDIWTVVHMRPGASPLASLAELLLRHAPALALGGDRPAEPVPGLAVEVDERAHVRAVLIAQPGRAGAILRAHAREHSQRVLVVVDQFEELFTLAERSVHQPFLACLAGIADDAGSPLRVLLSMRSDFLDRVAAYRDDLAIARNLTLLPPIDRDGMRAALVEPLRAVGHRWESAQLVDEMLDALEHTSGALPLLQFTAAALWDHRDRLRHVLTEDSYRNVGGVIGTLASHADAVLRTMSSAERTLARQLFVRLVTPERTRALVKLGQLRASSTGPDELVDELEPVLNRLIEARLLTVEGSGDDHSTVELVHESLIDAWPTLAHWLSADEEDAAFLARLDSAAQQWVDSGHEHGLLWRGQAAREAAVWHDRHADTVHGHAARYLDAVLALAERARRRRRQIMGGVITSLALIAAVMAWLAWQRGRAERSAVAAAARAERASAQVEREAARVRNATRMAAARAYDDDPTTKLSLLREIEGDPPPGWQAETRAALSASVAAMVLNDHTGAVYTVDFSPDGRWLVSGSQDHKVRVFSLATGELAHTLEGHEGGVVQVQFSASGSRLVSTSWDGTARVWTTDWTEPPTVLRSQIGSLVTSAVTADGERVATATTDGLIRLWRVDAPAEPVELSGHTDRVFSIDFSPDGTMLASGSWDGTVRIWDVNKHRSISVLRGHADKVWEVRFNPAGNRVLSSSSDGTIRVWPITGAAGPGSQTGARDVVVLRGHTAAVESASFSPDGRRIVSASNDGTVRIWPADGRGPATVLTGHTDTVVAAVFSPDGSRVASTSADRTLRLWTVDNHLPVRVLTGHQSWLYRPVFSPDGRFVATPSWDQSARVWPVAAPRTTILVKTGNQDSWTSENAVITYSPNGAWIAAVAPGHEVRVWHAQGLVPPRRLSGHSATIRSLHFSPDSRQLVTASDDGTVGLFPVDDDRPGQFLSGPGGRVLAARLSPDGQTIASVASDGGLRLWSVASGDELATHAAHSGWATEVTFTPTSQHVATAGRDASIRIWSLLGDRAPTDLTGHEGAITAIDMSPDGKWLASSSVDRTIRVWPMGVGQQAPSVLTGHTDEVLHVQFDGPGRRLLSRSKDETLRVWTLDDSRPPVILSGHEARITWSDFSPDGQRVMSASWDKSVRVWPADGSGPPIILNGHEEPIWTASRSPDGRHIISAGTYKTIRLWRDIEPLDAGSPRLWRATRYCLPVMSRKQLLGISEQLARAQHRSCRALVQRAGSARP